MKSLILKKILYIQVNKSFRSVISRLVTESFMDPKNLDFLFYCSYNLQELYIKNTINEYTIEFNNKYLILKCHKSVKLTLNTKR